MSAVGQAFTPPVPCTPPLHALDSRYLARKLQVKESAITLKSGRVIAYLEEGNPGDPAVVAFHGGCTTKLMWMALLSDPMPNIRFIAVDRPGFGKSSAVSWSDNYTFQDALVDMAEFLDALGVQKFAVLGHSNGTAFALQAAAAWPERVCACIVFASYTDPCHPRVNMDVAKANGLQLAGAFGGCCGSCFRGMMMMFLGPGDKRRPDKAFVGLEKMEAKVAAAAFADFSADPFIVSSYIDSWMSYDGKGADGTLWDMHRCRASKWPFDITRIQCPTYIWSGRQDWAAPLLLSEHNADVIPHSVLNILDGHAHVTTYPLMRNAVVGATNNEGSG